MQPQRFEQNHIASLREVIAALVGAVDQAPHLRDIVVGRLRRAGPVFGMP